MENLKKEIQSAVDVYKSGDLLRAELTCKKLISANPKVAFLYNLLGLILSGQKKIEAAIKSYEEGLKIDPDFAMIYNNLGLLFYSYRLDGNIEKIENYYKKSIFINKKIPEPHSNLGSLYNYLNNFDKAIKCHEKALLINSKFAFAHHNLGNIYVVLGDFTKAKKHYKASIKLNPDFYYSHRSLSRLIKYTEKEEHFILLKEKYNKVNKNDKEYKMNIAFSLAKAYDDMKLFDKAFPLYREANHIYRKKINFSINNEIKKFKEIMNIYNKNLFKKFTKVGYKDISPIFIVGMPRSGTTLIEQILSSHNKVFGADEVEFVPEIIKKNFKNDNPNSYFDGISDIDENVLKKMGQEYFHKMKKYSCSSERSTDKLPENFLSIGFIKLILPKSKVIHCYRNPMDNCFSIFKNHFPGGRVKFGFDLNEIVKYYNLYKDLMKYWNNLLPNFIINIKYENLISNTELEISNLLKACDLNWEKKCLNFYRNKRPIKTASDIQARSKIYKTSINSWKNYESHVKKYFAKLKV